jgi:hypothetical protein
MKARAMIAKVAGRVSSNFKRDQVVGESIQSVRSWIQRSHHGSTCSHLIYRGHFSFSFIILNLNFYPILSVLMLFLLVFPLFARATPWIQYPQSGVATLTHYTLPEDYIASCGCTAKSTHYPTAALNQMAFGSSTGYGPACGRCFKLTLLNTFLSDPPFYPSITKSVVVKVTDLCPISKTGWCNATASGPNACVDLLGRCGVGASNQWLYPGQETISISTLLSRRHRYRAVSSLLMYHCTVSVFVKK